MNIKEIEETIKELENGSTTYDSCLKLASLYAVRDKMNSAVVEQELEDILPAYDRYVDIKRNYQLNKATKNEVLSQMKWVCIEIKEFIQTLYASSTSDERELITDMITMLDAEFTA